MSLLAAVFTLRPQQHAAIPADQGRALAAEFLRWVQARDPAFAAELHRANERRPYTFSSLRSGSFHSRQLFLLPNHPVWWRVTTLTPRLSAFLQEQILPHLPAEITLGGQTFDVLSATCDARQHPWAGQTTFENLAAGALLEERQPRPYIQMEFATPTTFHSEGRHQPFPLPKMVFLQWLEKWNAFSPVRFPRDVIAIVKNHLAVSRYRLESHVVKFGETMFIGFTGYCSYRLLVEDPYWLRVLHALASFAFFCGTGAKTSFGMGQTRKIYDLDRKNSRSR
ncbi:MAG: CRISPR-associated endoribonuclease Cas6 [Candidatus Hadarchaeum sp.]